MSFFFTWEWSLSLTSTSQNKFANVISGKPVPAFSTLPHNTQEESYDGPGNRNRNRDRDKDRNRDRTFIGSVKFAILPVPGRPKYSHADSCCSMQVQDRYFTCKGEWCILDMDIRRILSFRNRSIITWERDTSFCFPTH